MESVKYFQEYLAGVAGVAGMMIVLVLVGAGAHFVIHNKSGGEPDLPQPVPKILMTLSGADCLG